MTDNLSLYERSNDRTSVTIVSIPFEYGSDARGLSRAPRYLLESGFERMLAALSRPVARVGEVECPRDLPPPCEFPKYMRETAAVARRAYALVAQARARGEVVAALCGDHASAIGSIMGAAEAGQRIGLIYFDAHPDIHTHKTTVSGNTHAFVTSAAMGQGHGSLTGIGERTVKIRPADVLYLGIKDFDEGEPALVRQSGARAFTMLDIAISGLAPVVAAIDELSSSVNAVWISMDMDSIDKLYAPGVAMPCEGGFTRREVLALAHYIGKRCTVAGFDIVEMQPEKDVDGKTAALALELSARFLGGEYTWYRSYMVPYEAKQITHAPRRVAKHPRPRAEAALRRWQASLRSLSRRRREISLFC